MREECGRCKHQRFPQAPAGARRRPQVFGRPLVGFPPAGARRCPQAPAGARKILGKNCHDFFFAWWGDLKFVTEAKISVGYGRKVVNLGIGSVNWGIFSDLR